MHKYKISTLRTHNISAKSIHLGMWLWCVVRGLKPKKTFNHVEIRYGYYTVGAVGTGVEEREWLSYWYSLKRAEIIEYVIEVTEAEHLIAQDFISRTIGTPYEYSMFWYHAKRIFTGKWSGSTDNSKMFCYEYAIKFLNEVRGYDLDPFMNPYEFKIWADKNILS